MLVQEDAADLIQTQVVEPTDEEENQKIEGQIGQVVIDIKLSLNNLKDQLDFSNQQIQEVYYDPFEKDQQKILLKLSGVERLSITKINELNQLYSQVDSRTKVLQGLAVDLGTLRKEIETKTQLRDNT